MTDGYIKCIEQLKSLENFNLAYEYYDTGDSLEIGLKREGATSISIKIQNSEVPEIDISIDVLHWYHSLGSSDELLDKISVLVNDINSIMNIRGIITAKKSSLTGDWSAIGPKGLKFLSTSKLAKWLPGKEKEIQL